MVTSIVILTLSAQSSEIQTIKQAPEKETYFSVGMNALGGQQNEDKIQPHSSVRQSQKDIYEHNKNSALPNEAKLYSVY